MKFMQITLCFSSTQWRPDNV